jgi:NAD(P)-dependent dehydrogenase (short-subunit alcohol dehydrogenase family)
MDMNEKKIILITGGNKGIGLEIARQAGKRGCRIILTARNETRGRKALEQLLAENFDADFFQMDVAVSGSIQNTAEEIRKRVSRIDVLINNAGISLDRSHSILDAGRDTLLETFHVNALGALEVTQSFLPLLKPGSRVINISSSLGLIHEGASSYAPVYSMSKTLLNAITINLAASLKSRNISVNSVCPGWCRTDMGGSGAPLSAADGADTAVWLALDAPQTITGAFVKDRKVLGHW